MVRINLALQGGGAHGAFTWGVLDRLLEQDDLEIAAISGTSAGALNGAALKSGLIENGTQGARDNLDWLWSQMGAMAFDDSPDWIRAWAPDPWLVSQTIQNAPGYVVADAIGRLTSPYSWGALYSNPLQKIVAKFDFGNVCADIGPELHICATNVRDGKVRVFTKDRITTQSILASACLPTLFQAVEVQDPDTGKIEAFWDGGYTGNPALFPLYAKHLPDDLVIVNINPLVRDEVPTTPAEIQNRINEISFNSSLLRELRAIEFVQRLIETGAVPEGSMKNVRVHMISDDGLMNALSEATKLVPVPSVLQQLKAAGRRAANRFLSDERPALGTRQSVDLREMFS